MRMICDGCQIPLYSVGEDSSINGGVSRSNGRELMIQGERVGSGPRINPFPQEDFHWCADCAKIAFRAVQSASIKAVIAG